MNTNHVFLTNNPEDKRNYLSIIENTAQAIAAAFQEKDDLAYSGPTPQELHEIINVSTLLPENGLGWEKVLSLLKEKVLPNFLRTPSCSYMAHLHGPSLVETIASELIIATFNQSMDSWDQSPVATEIELEVIKELCKLYGYNANSDGVFTSGGSQSNLTGITLARDWFCNEKLHYDIKKLGLPENYRKFRLYTSEISHFSMEKSTHLLGLGYNAVVKVPVNEKQQMDTVALANLIQKDIAEGNIPFCVVATIGTTDFGSIDSVAEIAPLCEKYGLWLHADAAYGSGVILSEKYKNRIGNLALCDSITVDFHKMFLMPISCSAILLKNKEHFEPLTLHADYLNREEDEEDGYTNLVDKSMQTTRRFDALKVWISFQTRGKDGWSELISTSMENATYFASQLRANANFEVITEPEISSVVFRLTPQNQSPETYDEVNKKVRRTLIHQEGVVIGQTVCNGNVCLKFTLLNPLITHKRIDELMLLIQKLGNA
ncbi:MAG: aspartate aminotransferase family protein [Spirochaetaceae bacterium]|nr:aspartate aminotransferase family protein [Spirochaetaceae bacterium]